MIQEQKPFTVHWGLRFNFWLHFFFFYRGCFFHWSIEYIPKKFRAAIIDELHLGHIVICKMKALVRFVHWPVIDSDVKDLSETVSKVTRPRDAHYLEYLLNYGNEFMSILPVLLLRILLSCDWCTFQMVGSFHSQFNFHENGSRLEALFLLFRYPRFLVRDNGGTLYKSRVQQSSNTTYYLCTISPSFL